MNKKIMATILATTLILTTMLSCTNTAKNDTGSSTVQSSGKVEFTPTPITPTPPKKEEPKTTDTPKTTENVTKTKVDKNITIVIDKDAGKKAKANNTIEIKAKPMAVKKSPTISISNKTLSIVKGKTANIKATCSTKGKVSYSSSNPKIATISSGGVVTAKATGKAIITACIGDSKNIKATCVVTVTNKASNTGKKPKDGDTKKVNGKMYIYDSTIASLGVPEWDGWCEYDPNPICQGIGCKKPLKDCICSELQKEFEKTYKCKTCGAKYGKCGCSTSGATFN